MNVLRLTLYQETVCYTKPFANKVAETYPLPPYSTVKGLIHEVLQAKTLIPFSLSIQGSYESRIVDYRKTYMIKKNAIAMPLIVDGLPEKVSSYSQGMTSMPLYTHMLYNMELIIHIKADEHVLQDIYNSFRTYDRCLSLGRQEDLIRIDSMNFVTLHECKEIDTFHAVYIPVSHIDEDVSGIPYQLNWTYTIKNGIREWRKIPVLYVMAKTGLDNEQFTVPLFTDGTYPVFLNE